MLKLYKRNLFNKHALSLSIIIVLQLVQNVCNLLLPSYNADIIDNGVVKGDVDYIVKIGSIMLIFAFIQILASGLSVAFATKIAYSFGADTRRDLFKNILNISTRDVSHFGHGSLVTRGTNDITQVQNTTYFLLTIIIGSPISLIGGLIMSYRQASVLMPIIGCVIAALIVIAIVFMIAVSPVFSGIQKSVDKLNTIIREQIGGVRVIRAFKRESDENKRFQKINVKLYSFQLKAGRWMGLMWPLVFSVANFSSIAVIYFGGIKINDGDLEIGALTAFLAYIMVILFSVLMSVMAFIVLPRAQVSAKRIEEVIDTKTDVVDSLTPVKVENIQGKITFSNVSFQYKNAQNPVLKDINFSIEPNQTTAIIGATGSGKSTIVCLLARLFDPTGGEIFIDDIPLKDIPLDDLPKFISVIPQKSFLFSGTIRSNILFGNPFASDDEIFKALEVAQAKDFVQNEEGKLEAKVSQGGSNFSGGQKQRLAIARSMVNKSAKIYLLDDPFSALDYTTDRKLRTALKEYITDASVFMVTQRYSTAVNADQIIVLDNGQIQGIGTHDELMKSCDVYKSIVSSQVSQVKEGGK